MGDILITDDERDIRGSGAVSGIPQDEGFTTRARRTNV
jgi:hypothetical protein